MNEEAIAVALYFPKVRLVNKSLASLNFALLHRIGFTGLLQLGLIHSGLFCQVMVTQCNTRLSRGMHIASRQWHEGFSDVLHGHSKSC